MTGSRYVLLGLAPARARWFREVAQWANTGAVSAEFVKCVSGEEARARLAGGRPFSALVMDATLQSPDRDLIDVARRHDCAVIVVAPARVAGQHEARDWSGLGATALLVEPFGRKELIDVLAANASMIGRSDRADTVAAADVAGWRAPVIAVTGPGGTGASTIAIALAQGLAADVRQRGSVLLADFRLRAEQAMLHDARDVVPGVEELVDAFRSGQPSAAEVRALTFAVPARGYRLLLGLRRSRSWSAIRPRSFEAALDTLRCSFRSVVADVDPDLEGEDEGGSVDVEERHVMARATLADARAVFVVGRPGMKGVHALTTVVNDVLEHGIAGVRVVPVVNQAPRRPAARAEITRAVAALLPAPAGAGVGSPVFVPERRVDEALHDGAPLHERIVAPLAGAFRAVVARTDGDAARPAAPQRVPAGSLGSWAPDLAGNLE